MTLERSVLGGLAAVLVLAFFLPWMFTAVVFVPMSANGFTIKDLLLAGISIRLAFSTVTFAGLLTLLWPLVLSLLYLIPLGAAAVALLAFVGRVQGRLLRLPALGLGLFVAVMCVTVLACAPFAYGDRDVASLSFGFWLTLLAGLGLIGAALVLPRSAATGPLLSQSRQEELQARGQQAMTQAADWLAQRRVELEAGIEARRIQSALGRRIDRTILDVHDAVVAPQGTVITHELVERARHAGVLAALLGSAEARPLPDAAPSEPS